MQEIRCKKCSSTSCVKSGYIRGNQRYKCKECGCNFKIDDSRGKASYGMIARLFNVSRSTVLYWIRTMGSNLPEPVLDTEIESVSIDEMWHFICKKTKNMGLAGSGLP